MTFDNAPNAFVAKVSQDGSSLVYCTYLPGSKPIGIEVDRTGSVWIKHSSTIGRLSPAGDSYQVISECGPWDCNISTYHSVGLAIDDFQRSYWCADWKGGMHPRHVDVRTSSGFGGALQEPTIIFSSFGADSTDYAGRIASSDSSHVIVVGTTYSPDFPVTSGAYDGSYNGRRDLWIARINVDPPPPYIQLVPSSLYFATQENDALPTSKEVTVTNPGSDVLGWSASVDVGWLDVTPTSGNSNSSVLDIRPNTTQMPPDLYTATITITSGNASNSPQYIDIYYTVDSCGGIGFTPQIDGWQLYNTTPADIWPDQTVSFPTWDIWVAAFGTDQCYYDMGLPDPFGRKEFADRTWRIQRDNWGGSCFGMSATSLLFFDKYFLTDNVFGTVDLFHVLSSIDSRFLINTYQTRSYGSEYQLHYHAVRNTPASDVIQELDEYLSGALGEQGHVVLNITPLDHAVVPYRCSLDPNDSDVKLYYYYDPNIPGIDNRFFKYRVSTGEWTFGSGWLSDGIFLSRPSSVFLEYPTIVTPGQVIGLGLEEFLVDKVGPIVIDGVLGTIGYINNLVTNTISDAFPLFGLHGDSSAPYGYLLPLSHWSVEGAGELNDTASILMGSGEIGFLFSQLPSSSDSTFHISYSTLDTSLTIYDLADSTSQYEVRSIHEVSDSSVSVDIQSTWAGSTDSVVYRMSTSGAAGRVLPGSPGLLAHIGNFGSAVHYDLTIEIRGSAAPEGFGVITVDSVYLSENTEHLIVPDWRAFGDSVMILIDNGMTGQITDTLFYKGKLYSCCGHYTAGQSGNADCSTDGKRNLADITRLIDAVYISKSTLCCPENGNVDGDAEAKTNLADITRLIDHVYISKGETAQCE